MKEMISIIGYSGHSYVCIEAAKLLNLKINSYYDLNEQSYNPYSLKYLGEESNIKTNNRLFVTIGDNNIRRRIYNELKNNNCFDDRILHPNSTISSTAEIQQMSFIGAGAVINAFAKISHGSIINTGAVIEHESKLGAFCHISSGAVLAGNVKVGENSFIGANASIKQGVNIGANVIIGAGSVIIKDVPDGVTIVGNPGEIIKS